MDKLRLLQRFMGLDRLRMFVSFDSWQIIESDKYLLKTRQGFCHKFTARKLASAVFRHAVLRKLSPT
jgi:hypothetical protein